VFLVPVVVTQVPYTLRRRSFTLKTRQMFYVRTRSEEFENAPITGHVGFVFAYTSGKGISWLSWRHRFRKDSFSKCFPSTLKRKACVFKFFRFEERFRKASFSWRISVNGRPNWRNKAAISNFSSAVLTGPKLLMITRDTSFSVAMSLTYHCAALLG